MGFRQFRSGRGQALPSVPDLEDLGAVKRYLEQLQRVFASGSDLQTISARVRRSTNQTINDSTFTAVSFDTVIYDNGGLWDSSIPTKLTAPISGVYMLTASVEWASNTSGDRNTYIVTSTTTPAIDLRRAAAGGTVQVTIAGLASLSEGEAAELYGWQNRGGTLNINTQVDYSPVLAMHWLGPVQE